MTYLRHIMPQVLSAIKDTPVIVINGPRQSGKSTFCEQLIKQGHFDGQYISLDDPMALATAHQNPLGFLESLNKHVIIDEIQRAPGLFLNIKKLVDQDRKNRRFILTGSTDILTLPRLADSLAGRMEIYALWPLSQGEIRKTKETFIEAVFSEHPLHSTSKISWDHLLNLMAKGGYPEAIKRPDETRRLQWYKSYLASIMEKDIRDLSHIEGLTVLPNLLELLATRVGSLVNFSDLSRLIQIPATTLKRYYALLQKVFLIVALPAWTQNAEGRLIKSPKLYMNDAGLLCALRKETLSDLKNNRTGTGIILENFVVMELAKQLTWSSPFNQMYHFRSHQGHEVDVVLEGRNKKIVGIEVKSASSVTEKDFKGLRALQETTGSQFHRGIVLYTGDQTYKIDRNMFAVPLATLWD